MTRVLVRSYTAPISTTPAPPEPAPASEGSRPPFARAWRLAFPLLALTTAFGALGVATLAFMFNSDRGDDAVEVSTETDPTELVDNATSGNDGEQSEDIEAGDVDPLGPVILEGDEEAPGPETSETTATTSPSTTAASTTSTSSRSTTAAPTTPAPTTPATTASASSSTTSADATSTTTSSTTSTDDSGPAPSPRPTVDPTLPGGDPVEPGTPGPSVPAPTQPQPTVPGSDSTSPTESTDPDPGGPTATGPTVTEPNGDGGDGTDTTEAPATSEQPADGDADPATPTPTSPVETSPTSADAGTP